MVKLKPDVPKLFTAELDGRGEETAEVFTGDTGEEIDNELVKVLVKVWKLVRVKKMVVLPLVSTLVLLVSVVVLNSVVVLKLGMGVTTKVVVATATDPEAAGVYPSSQEVVPLSSW